MPLNSLIHDHLLTFRRTVPEAARILHLDLGEGFDHWVRTVDQKLLPRMDTDYPLTVAVCGGGSAGKSTLFNMLVGRPLSPVGGKAGLNRRVLLAGRQAQLANAGYRRYLGHTFGAQPEPLNNPGQLLQPGPPLYCDSEHLPESVVLLDTPDIDTGAKGVYTNREMARQALEIADLFIYLFTNATYNNRDNTDFISRMLTGMGSRPSYLVYRVYPGFSDQEVQAHAHTVADNLYGTQANEQVLGLFRVDEDNAVAAGEQAPALTPVYGARQDLMDTLMALDIDGVRAGLMGSMVKDAFEYARQAAGAIRQAAVNLERYAEALEAVQVAAAQHVLSHFPADRVLRRFARIWMQTDPSHIKWMRTTGRIIGWPVKTVARAIGRMGAADITSSETANTSGPESQVEMDLLSAANQLYQKIMETHLAADGEQVPVPGVLNPIQDRLGQQPWQETLETIVSHKERVLSWSSQLDEDLKALSEDLRQRMGFLDQVRQTFAALLNVIPATVAVTYILHTGDPLGAAGIKIKLTGFLGLHDLYALVAIPTTAGISKADRRQLEALLQPLAQTWLSHKFNTVQKIFERHITGPMLKSARTALAQMEPLIREIEGACGSVEDSGFNPQG